MSCHVKDLRLLGKRGQGWGRMANRLNYKGGKKVMSKGDWFLSGVVIGFALAMGIIVGSVYL